MHQGRAIIASYSGFLAPGVAAIFLLPAIVSSLGPERYSHFSNLYNYSVFLLMLDLGISAGVSRRIGASINAAKTKYRLANLVWFAILAQLVISLGLVLITLTIALNFLPKLSGTGVSEGEILTAYIAISLSVAPTMFCGTFRGAFEGAGKHYSAASIRISTGLVGLVAPVVLPLFVADLGVIFFAICLGRVGIAFAAGVMARNYFGLPVRRSHRLFRSYVSALLGDSIILSIGHLAGSLITLGLIDRMLLTTFYPPSYMIDYVMAKDVVIRVLLIPSAICVVLMPLLAERDSGLLIPKDKFLLMERVFSMQVLPVCGLILAWSELLMSYLSDSSTTRLSALLLAGSLVGFYFYCNSFIFHTYLIASGKIWAAARRHLYQLPIVILSTWFAVKSGSLLYFGFIWLIFCFADIWMTYRPCSSIGILSRDIRPISAEKVFGGSVLCIAGFIGLSQSIKLSVWISVVFLMMLGLNALSLYFRSEVFGFGKH